MLREAAGVDERFSRPTCPGAPSARAALATFACGDLEADYVVLLNSYLWGGGAGFPHDPALTPVMTGEHMRDPVIEWTQSLLTSVKNPLESHLDPDPRDQ